MPEVQGSIRSINTISRHPELYHGWPTIGRRRNGELLVVYSGGRETHICPFGRVELIRSSDQGQTWSEPTVVVDGPLDDRDAGVLETSRGTLLINWFTSLAWRVRLEKLEAGEPPQKHSPRDPDRWRQVRDQLDDATCRNELGGWIIRSEDGGQTWSNKIDTLVNSPHGPTQLSDGRLLYVGRLIDQNRSGEYGGSPFTHETGLVASESRDDGKTWQVISQLPLAPGHEITSYHEAHAVEAADGRIVVQIRNHGAPHRLESIQTESFDGGCTWTQPHSIGVNGFPSHLLRLRDGRLLMTYGHRVEPRGNQARVSEDHGQTWSAPIFLLDKGVGDLGYPSTAQLDDDSLVSVWYEQARGEQTNAELRQAQWSLH